MYPVDEAFQGDICYFAVQIGGGTLAFAAPDTDAFEYDALLTQPSDLLGALFTIYLTTHATSSQSDVVEHATTRAAQYLAWRCVPGYRITPPLTAADLNPSSLPHPVSTAIVTLADELGRGTLVPEVLGDVAYHDYIVGTGALLGDVFALFTTLLRLDADEQVVNLAHARWRTAQYVRAYVDPTYQVEPPFTEDETGGLEP
jgi:hypothetical protein